MTKFDPICTTGCVVPKDEFRPGFFAEVILITGAGLDASEYLPLGGLSTLKHLFKTPGLDAAISFVSRV